MKSTTIFLFCALLLSTFTFAQTSTEQFETESTASTSFTDNGVIFNILSTVSTYDIYSGTNAYGWNGFNAADFRFIDNTGTATPSYPNSSLSIKTTSNLFKVNRFWAYLANGNGLQVVSPTVPVVGTLTITGKLSGITKFTQTKTSGFTTSTNTANGFTLIDMTNLNGQNYSNIVIDQLTITVGGEFRYLALDAFTWVKDTGIVLSANDVQASKKELSIYPNPTSGPLTIKAVENTKFDVYSQSGQLVKTIEAKKGVNQADISELPKGVYIVKSPSESQSIIKK